MGSASALLKLSEGVITLLNVTACSLSELACTMSTVPLMMPRGPEVLSMVIVAGMLTPLLLMAMIEYTLLPADTWPP